VIVENVCVLGLRLRGDKIGFRAKIRIA